MKRFLISVVLFGAVAGLIYLATVGCCQLMARSGRSVSLTEQLQLTPAQRRSFASLEKGYLAQKEIICQRLCEKRAQLIELLKAPVPDRALIAGITEEIGREQTFLEKGTLDHLLALRNQLTPEQGARLVGLVSRQLSQACQMTGCSEAGVCFVERHAKR